MSRIIDTLEGLLPYKHVLLLYSGGVDSSYALLWCLKNKIKVTAFRAVNTTTKTARATRQFLESKQIELLEADYTDELVTDFIAKGILAGGYYQNRFPISSSYTRPLIAKMAVEVAKNRQIKCIVHTSNFHQNSAARFNNSVMVHHPGITIAIPYINSSISRSQKLAELAADNYELEGSIFSIDENLWSRVIENGDLDNIQTTVSDKHFTWTDTTAPTKQKHIKISFHHGLPVALDGEKKSLRTIIEILNQEGAAYSIGRYNGLEDTPNGIKNHEVREAPAAEILYKAKRFIESCNMTQNELKLKSELDYRWTELVVNGNWFSLEKQSIEAAITQLNVVVSGTVEVILKPNCVFPASILSEMALDFNTLEEDIEWAKNDFSYPEYYHFLSISNRMRARTGLNLQ